MVTRSEHELTIHKARYVDVYTDAVRVHRDERDGIPEGRICRVTVVNGKSGLFAMRGLQDSERGWIRIDDVGRERLGLQFEEKKRFTFRKANWFEAVRWAMKASQPGARIATWLAFWSVLIGVAALFPLADMASHIWSQVLRLVCK